jgi:uncharacterized RDD family membrane protein YckC
MSDLPGQTTEPSGAPPPGGGQPGYQQQQPVAYSPNGPSGPRSGFWRRFAAAFIDGILMGIVQFILLAVFKDSAGIGYILYLAVNWGYFTYFEGGATGQTVGKMALSIRVIDLNTGGPIGYGRGFIRQLVKIVSGAVFLLGYLWMLWDREKQTWQDKAAGSVVVPIEAYPVQR